MIKILPEQQDYSNINIKNDLKTIIFRLSFALSIPLINISYFILNSINQKRHEVYNVSMSLDNKIPFVPQFIIPYVIWYFYVFFALFYFCIKDYEKYKKMLMTMLIGLTTCYIIYFFFPTTVVRASNIGNSLTEKLVKIIYQADKPFNCFPSIHVLQTIIVMTYVHSSKQVRLFSKVFVDVIGISIIISTLFVKQHAMLDAVGGILVAWIAYYLVSSINVNGFFKKKRSSNIF